MSRLFFAIWPDDDIRAELTRVAGQFKDENLRLVKPSNLHMTLAFLGEVSEHVEKEVIREAAAIKCKPFKLTLTRVGWWEKPRIVWLGPQQVPAALSELVEAIMAILKPHGIKPDKRRYKPHVTIARKAKQFSAADFNDEIQWRVNRFALVVSVSTDTGVQYRVLQEWALNESRFNDVKKSPYRSRKKL